MKRLSLFLCFSLLLTLVFSGTAGIWTLAATEDGVISVGVDADVTDRPLDVTFKVPASQAGTYTVTFLYTASESRTAGMEIALKLDGQYPSEAFSAIDLPRFFTTDHPYMEDGQGNQFAAPPVLYGEDVSYTLANVTGFSSTPLQMKLSSGEHTLTVEPVQAGFHLSKVRLEKPEKPAAYKAPKLTKKNTYTGDPIIIEGESAYLKSSYWLTTGSDGNSVKPHPSDAVLSKINFVGGSTWKSVGDSISWNVNVPKSGYYNLSFSYRQNYVLNGSTYRALTVNGKTPFAEATSIAFPYGSDWQTKSLGVDEKKGLTEPYCIYLEEGDNQITLTGTLGEYSAVCDVLEEIVNDLGELYVDITMVTGETVDIYRDYNLFDQIPDFNKRLDAVHKKLLDADDELMELAAGDASSYSTSVRNMANVVKLMRDNPYTAHRYKSSYYSNYCALSACVNDIQNTPLDIDQLAFFEPGKTESLTKKGFFSDLWDGFAFGVERLWASFTQDYNNISGNGDNEDSITVWISWGRDQAQVLNRLIQSTFTNSHNIDVNVKISNASIVQGVLSGNGPDVILQRSRTEPVNLAMRGVLYDLSQFDDCQEVLKRFQKDADLPYRYNGGVYALPDTQIFQVLFYRTDIMKELNLDVPTTWEDFRTVTRRLARNNLNTWMPYTQITDMTVVNNGIGSLNMFPTLLLQNGLSLYNKDLTKTTLTDASSIAVFSEWTENYTKLKVPYQLDFYNRFRIGTCPIGVAPYATYCTLKDTAKEIDGKWQIAPIPGVVQEDGSICNVNAGSGSGCSILKMTKNPEAAWEFLKWWTSAETQLAYSNNLESILGPIGRMSVANVEAFKQMTWDMSMYDQLLDSWKDVREIEEVPGSYYVSRSVDMAFWNVAGSNKNARDMMVSWGEEADNEITRKLEQYENR